MIVSFFKKLPHQQRFFLSSGVLFAVLLVGFVVYRSATRPTLLSKNASGTALEKVLGSAKEATFDSSGLHLQDFHRVEVKNGVPVWEVIAKDAKYHADEQLAFVSDAEVKIYQGTKSSISFHSNEGKLFLAGNSLQKADLRGNIEVVMDNEMHVKADIASYDRVADTITAVGKVTIFGPGYQISGNGLRFGIEGHTVELLSEVESHFERGAQMLPAS